MSCRSPKLRQGSYFPSFLEPRRRSEPALLAVVQQAYVCGVSTRSARALWRAATPICFTTPSIEKVRDGGRVVNKALVIARGVHETGRREILSIDVGEAETEAFWTDFLEDWSSAA